MALGVPILKHFRNRSLVYQEDRKQGRPVFLKKKDRSVSVLLALLVHHIGQSGFDKFWKGDVCNILLGILLLNLRYEC